MSTRITPTCDKCEGPAGVGFGIDPPTTGLRLPPRRRADIRIAAPDQAEALLLVLPARERVVWATAFYAGLRRGELVALRWSDVDLAKSEIRVERGWDPVEGPIAPKSEKGRRTVPIPAALSDYLREHRAESWTEGFVFGEAPETPLGSQALVTRTRRIGRRPVSHRSIPTNVATPTRA